MEELNVWQSCGLVVKEAVPLRWGLPRGDPLLQEPRWLWKAALMGG